MVHGGLAAVPDNNILGNLWKSQEARYVMINSKWLYFRHPLVRVLALEQYYLN